MQIIIGLVFIYISIVFGGIFFSSIFNKKIERTLAISICEIIVLLYIFGMVNLLKLGVYITVVINLVLGIYGIVKKKKEIVELILTSGLAFFSLMYFIFMLTNLNKPLVFWDQFSYRSLNTKVMFYTDTMLSGYGRVYPPASTLLQYFFLKLIGTYIQGIEAFAMQIFGIALMLPMYEKVKKKLTKTIIGTIIICIPAIFIALNFYETSYPDATIGFILGFIFYTYFKEVDFNFKVVSMILSIGILVLLKPLGIAISLIILSVFAIYEVISNQYYKKENIKQIFKNKNLKYIFIILLCSIALYIGFKCFSHKYYYGQVKEQDDLRGNTIEYISKGILATVFGVNNGTEIAAESNRTFVSTMYSMIGFSVPVYISLYATTIIILIIYFVYYCRKKDKDFLYQAISIVIGLLLYCVALQYSYLTKFQLFEIVEHNALDRYYLSYLLGMIVFIVANAINSLNNIAYSAKKYIFLLLAVLLFTPLAPIWNATIASGIYNNQLQELNYTAEELTRIIDENIEKDSKIITIMQTQKDDREKVFNLKLRYYLYPKHESVALTDTEKWKEIYKINGILENGEYDYLFILTKSDELEELFKDLFSNEFNLKNNTLYKIEYKDNKVRLVEQLTVDKI